MPPVEASLCSHLENPQASLPWLAWGWGGGGRLAPGSRWVTPRGLLWRGRDAPAVRGRSRGRLALARVGGVVAPCGGGLGRPGLAASQSPVLGERGQGCW